MNKAMSRFLAGGALTGAGVAIAAIYLRLLRPRHLVWGSSSEEISKALPMDDVVGTPTYVTTRTIAIHATPEEIWPWLAQMGELPRAGFYSYVTVERALGMKVKNASEILPEFQKIAVGDALDRNGTMVVRDMEEGHWIVLGPPNAMANGVDVTWCMILEPQADGSTHLISRCRARLPRGLAGAIAFAILDPGQFIMERKWLLGLKSRAESHRRECTSVETRVA